MVTATYSISAKVGGSGIGYTAFQAASGLERAGLLGVLYASSNAQSVIPASRIRQWGLFGRGLKYAAAKDRTGLVYYLETTLFDAWVAATLPAADIFHGWNGMCRLSIRRARERGQVTIVERASSHPLTQRALLTAEYARYGVPSWIPPWGLRRSVAEIVEADYVTIPSGFVRSSMREQGVPDGKLIEIPFGADLDRFHPADQPRSGGPFRCIFVGQVSLQKGIPHLLAAWEKLGWRDAELRIVGAHDADIGPVIARWANLPGLTFIPHSRQVPDLFRESDVFVFPSIQEGSALVTYEALATGLPVVTTPNAGSVVRDGEDGYIVPAGDADAIADRLERLRADPALRRHLGRSARARAEEFPWSAYQRRLAEAHRRIGGERRPPPDPQFWGELWAARPGSGIDESGHDGGTAPPAPQLWGEPVRDRRDAHEAGVSLHDDAASARSTAQSPPSIGGPGGPVPDGGTR